MLDIEKKVIEIIRSFTFIDEEIQETDKLVILGIDSLMLVEVIIALENEFDVIFDDSVLNPQNFENVQSLVDLVKSTIET